MSLSMPITNFHVYFIDVDNFLRKFVDGNESANKSVIDVDTLIDANKVFSNRHREVCRCQ